jgi:hypothetical protein
MIVDLDRSLDLVSILHLPTAESRYVAYWPLVAATIGTVAAAFGVKAVLSIELFPCRNADAAVSGRRLP